MDFYFGKHFLILFLLYIFISFPIVVTPLPNFIYNLCPNSASNFTKNSTYQRNLNSLQSSLPSGINDYGFNSSMFGNTPDTVYEISVCRGDVDIETCRDCVSNATSKITQVCPYKKEAIVWYDECMLQYSDNSIYGVLDHQSIKVGLSNVNNASSKNEFNAALGTLFTSLRSSASKGGDHKKYAANSINGPDVLTIYGVMQCRPDLSEQDCDSCLNSVTSYISYFCPGKVGCRIMGPSCSLRYETNLFYNDTPSAPPPETPPPDASTGKGHNTNDNSDRMTIIIITSTVGSVIVLILCTFIFLNRKKIIRPRRRVESVHEYSNVDDISHVDSLQYDFELIRQATNNFSVTNKLGQGGFGPVYKGRLQNGQEIAVKRLSQNSGQGEHEFKNEVMLVAKLQHRNLVRLLGFSLEGTERLLIYEFVTNSSLDQFIFNPVKGVLLDWDLRYKIINGIAKGLLYLHEDSRLRIIHRDMKASNVLLDSEMQPKISDFGMARLCVMDETHGSTNRIVGTYGYMAPEYAMHGIFSVKSDVFSFGVLILEIVTGQKNRYVRNDDSTVEDLLSNVWKSWCQGTAHSLIDPMMRPGSTREIMRCIHIGLLCVQEHVVERPTMASIVLMLSSFSLSLPMPLRPAFFPEGVDISGMVDPLDISEMTDQSSGLKKTPISLSQNEASITELYPR